MLKTSFVKMTLSGVAALLISSSSWAAQNQDQLLIAAGGHGGGGHSGGGHSGGGGHAGGGGGHAGAGGGGHVGGGRHSGGGGGHVAGGGSRPGGGGGGANRGGGGRPGGNGGGRPGGGTVGGGGNHGGGNHAGGGRPGGGNGNGGRPGGGTVGGGGGNHGGGNHAGGGRPGGGNGNGGRPGGGNGGGTHAGGGKHNGGKPIGVNPGRTITHEKPSRVVSHQKFSHMERGTTRNNQNVAWKHATGVNHSAAVRTRLSTYGKNYSSVHNRYLQNRYNTCGGFYRNNAYRYHYSHWYKYGFCGGFHYPVYPWYNISAHFVYPMVNWMYVKTVDTEYYQNWYGADYNTCPVTSFPYATAYYPTVQMRDLGFDMSGLSAATQCNFRQAMIKMTRDLIATVSVRIAGTYQVADSDIIVNHYENLADGAVVLEGFVNQDNINLPFKAMLDLVTPANTWVFIPTDAEPTANEINQLDSLNTQIKDHGGDPTAIDEEPENLVTPPPAN